MKNYVAIIYKLDRVLLNLTVKLREFFHFNILLINNLECKNGFKQTYRYLKLNVKFFRKKITVIII